jgi:DNA-binding transcriptional MerR regulator
MSATPAIPHFYTRKQVADIVGVNVTTISRWEKKGLVTCSQRFNGMFLYTENDLEAIKKVASTTLHVEVPEELKCTICHQRQARKNSTVCSRCSFKKVRESLRDTLPNMPITNREYSKQIEHATDCSMNTDGVECTCGAGLEEVDIEDANNRTTETIMPGVDQYTRAQVSEMIGVSPSTIFRWEAKGATPLPMRLASNNQYVYTEEILHKICDYAEQMLLVEKKTPIERAARMSSKNAGKAERAVATAMKNLGGRGSIL